MLFNRIMVFIGGMILFALGLFLAAAAWPWPPENTVKYADIAHTFIVTCDCIWPSNAWWYGALGYLLMLAPVLYLWNIWSAWRIRRFWQIHLGPNVISVDLKPLERALRNQLEMQEDVEAAKIRLIVPEFGRNHLTGILSLTIAEQPNLNGRVEELRQLAINQVRTMLPELKLAVRVRIRLASRLDARLFLSNVERGGDDGASAAAGSNL